MTYDLLHIVNDVYKWVFFFQVQIDLYSILNELFYTCTNKEHHLPEFNWQTLVASGFRAVHMSSLI